MSGVLTNTFFDDIERQLLDLLHRISSVLQAEDIPHRVVGGLAVYLHVNQAEQDAGRLTRDVDIAVRRFDLARIIELAERHGFEHRRAFGIDTLHDRGQRRSRRAVQLLFASEKVRPEYVEPVPGFEMDPVIVRGAWLMPVQELLHMKLTSFRLKDRVHVRDMDEVHLLTPEMEASLSQILRERLAEIRATE